MINILLQQNTQYKTIQLHDDRVSFENVPQEAENEFIRILQILMVIKEMEWNIMRDRRTTVFIYDNSVLLATFELNLEKAIDSNMLIFRNGILNEVKTYTVGKLICSRIVNAGFILEEKSFDITSKKCNTKTPKPNRVKK